MVFEGIDFDMVMMNPPYDGNTHLKVLDHVSKQLTNAEIVSLQPVRWLQDPLAEYKKTSDYKKFSDIRTRISSVDIFPMYNAMKIFGIEIRTDLGVYHLTKEGSYIKENNSLYDKVIKKLLDTKDNLFNHLSKSPSTDLYVKFVDGVTTFNNGVVTDTTFCIVSPNFKTATTGIAPGHTKYMDVKSVKEQHNVQECYNTRFMKWWSKCICGAVTNHKFTPYFDFSHTWTDQMLYEYFDLTEEEIREIESQFQ